jgi:hypothetical protein
MAPVIPEDVEAELVAQKNHACADDLRLYGTRILEWHTYHDTGDKQKAKEVLALIRKQRDYLQVIVMHDIQGVNVCLPLTLEWTNKIWTELVAKKLANNEFT